MKYVLDRLTTDLEQKEYSLKAFEEKRDYHLKKLHTELDLNITIKTALNSVDIDKYIKLLETQKKINELEQQIESCTETIHQLKESIRRLEE